MYDPPADGDEDSQTQMYDPPADGDATESESDNDEISNRPNADGQEDADWPGSDVEEGSLNPESDGEKAEAEDKVRKDADHAENDPGNPGGHN